jgi:hypothetical protein
LTRRAFEFGREHGFVIIPVPDAAWNGLPLVARVPVDWGAGPAGLLIAPETLGR